MSLSHFYGQPSTHYATSCCMDNIILYTVHHILFNQSVFNNLSSSQNILYVIYCVAILKICIIYQFNITFNPVQIQFCSLHSCSVIAYAFCLFHKDFPFSIPIIIHPFVLLNLYLQASSSFKVP